MLPRCRLSAKPGGPQSPTSASSREPSCRPRVSDSGHPPVPLSCYPGSSRKARTPSPAIRPLTCYFLVAGQDLNLRPLGYENRRHRSTQTSTAPDCQASPSTRRQPGLCSGRKCDDTIAHIKVELDPRACGDPGNG